MSRGQAIDARMVATAVLPDLRRGDAGSFATGATGAAVRGFVAPATAFRWRRLVGLFTRRRFGMLDESSQSTVGRRVATVANVATDSVANQVGAAMRRYRRPLLVTITSLVQLARHLHHGSAESSVFEQAQRGTVPVGGRQYHSRSPVRAQELQ